MFHFDYNSKQRIWFTALLILLSLMLPACREEQRPPAPTAPQVEVAVFGTEAPTNTPVPSPTPDNITPTAESTTEISAATPDASTENPVSTANNRPANVNPLTGLEVDDPATLKRRPLMVRVGNDPAARPQVGLNQADVVYEELVEWWVTRFTAIYLSQTPEMIAPIRSARLINLYLTPQYQGALVNSGGSDPVRWELSQSDIINLDEFFIPDPFFYRENEGWQTRLAVNGQAARDYLTDEALDTAVNLRGFVFSEALDLTAIPTEAIGPAQEITIPYPAQSSEAQWQYDPAGGKYLRFTTGEPMMNFDGSQVAASNVIIYFADHQPTDIVEDSNGATSIRTMVNGFGTAWLLRDGGIAKGNWQTEGRDTPQFLFNDGRPMPLKPGNTWIEVVPLEYTLDIDGVEHSRLDIETEATEESPGATDTPAPAPSPTLTPIGAPPATTESP